MDRLLLVDSDIFILLSAAGLLERVAELLGFSVDDIRRLHALPHMLQHSKSMRRNFSEAVRERAIVVANRVVGIYERPPEGELPQRLLSIDYIDDGEALLIAHLVERPTCLLASGDLRAMRALASAEGFQDVRDAIRGRVICLEAVVRMLVEADGVAATATAFQVVLPHSRHLQIFFSEANVANQEQCLDAVRSFYTELRDVHRCDFLFWPE